ncbi:hypothetical protein B0H15DRAFT_873013 [Mycena belliarum]|uniref:Uncharacterized protein n=1 Tax=Mycena belliarum TaxID=1033014 RepID=A0AAD6XD89_9AGAR|nr:hypothetical protein B0H15DRAFT_873013 [Mycena belliae]
MKLRWSSYNGALPLEQQGEKSFPYRPCFATLGPASATFLLVIRLPPPSRWKPLRHRAHCTPRCGTAVFVGRSGLSRRRSFTTLVVYTVSDTGGMEHSSSQNTLPPPQRLPFSTLLPCFGQEESGSTSAQSSWWNIRRGGALRLAGELAAHRDRHGNTRAFKVSIRSTETFIRALPTARQSAAPV